MTIDFHLLRSLTDTQVHRREMAAAVDAENSRRAAMLQHPSQVTRLHGSVGDFEDAADANSAEIVRLREHLADVIDLDSKRGGRA